MNRTEEVANTIVKAIQKKSRISSWDICKEITIAKHAGCYIRLRPCHADELDMDDLATLSTSTKSANTELMNLGYKEHNAFLGYKLPDVDGEELFQKILKACDEEHKKLCGMTNSALDYSLYIQKEVR